MAAVRGGHAMSGSRFRTISPLTPPGLKIAYEVISCEEERQLIRLIEAAGLRYPPYDPGNLRSSASFGWKYDFANDCFAACPVRPEGFGRVEETAAEFAGVRPGDFAECLLNRYEPGAIIQPHLDKPVWEHVVGVSLGGETTMNFRKAAEAGYEHAHVALPPRSIYLLRGAARHEFEHSLPPSKETRWSITFRTLSLEGLRQQALPTASL
jgi:alkylated DNA repair dioxygenase AlkB